MKHTVAALLALALTPAPAPAAPAFAGRIGEIQQAITQAGLDGWLLFDFRGSNPLAWRVLGLDPNEAITTRRWYYWIPKTGEPVRLVHAIEEGRLDALPGAKKVYLAWEERHRLLKEILAGARTVAMEHSPLNDIPTLARVDAGTVDLVRSLGVEVVSSGDLISRFESTWTPEMLASHREAAAFLRRFVDEVFADVGRALAAGMVVTERHVQTALLGKMRAAGLVEDPPIVAVSHNAANPHYTPSAERPAPISRGDLLLIDISSRKKDGGRTVYADLTRMAYCGRRKDLPEEMARAFAAVREARDAAFAAVKRAFAEGRPITGAEVDDVARGVIRKAGFGANFLHRTGHSIGEEVHGSGTNLDNLESRDTRRILPRTCFSIEPGIYLPGRFGVRSEIDVWVGDGGPEITTGPPQADFDYLLD